MYKKKVSIIGSGFVGSSIVYALAIKGLTSEIVIIDKPECGAKTEAEVADIRHGIPYMGSANIYAGTYADIIDSDLIIITAGRSRRQGESRLEMAADNVKIAFDITENIKKFYNSGAVLIVTNPVDIITRCITEWLNLPLGSVFGSGCILDTSRLVNVISDFVGLSPDVVTAQVIGEHGESQIALWSKTAIAGIPIEDYCKSVGLAFTDEERLKIESKVRKMGTEIIAGKGKTHYGIATCVCYIADAVLNRRSTICAVSGVLHGEYGINGIAMSVPSIVGAYGVERKLVDYLSETEYEKLKKAGQQLDAIYSSLFSLNENHI